MTTNDQDRYQARKISIAVNNEQAKAPQARAYQSPEIHDLGSLAQLQHVGCNWHDGCRYKDNLS
jgi:hypothetical protein